MFGERALQHGKPAAAMRRADHLELAHHRAGGGQAAEPRRTGKVVTARQHRVRRRYQPCAQAHHRALAEAGGNPALAQRPDRDIDPDLARRSARRPLPREPDRQRQAQPPLGGLVFAVQHLAVNERHHRPRDRLGTDHRRAGPDQRDAEGEDQPASDNREAQVRPALVDSASRRPERQRSQPRSRAAGNRRAP